MALRGQPALVPGAVLQHARGNDGFKNMHATFGTAAGLMACAHEAEKLGNEFCLACFVLELPLSADPQALVSLAVD
jgi:hypothetical protein